MASTRLRLVSLFAVAAIAAGACNATASPGASGTAAGNDCTAGTGSGNLQVPDVLCLLESSPLKGCVLFNPTFCLALLVFDLLNRGQTPSQAMA